jgi:hypothetical protein
MAFPTHPRKRMTMPKRALKIDVSTDLPPRVRPLSDLVMSEVWGGCTNQFKPCQMNNDCCPGMQCGAVYQYTPSGMINPLICDRFR